MFSSCESEFSSCHYSSIIVQFLHEFNSTLTENYKSFLKSLSTHFPLTSLQKSAELPWVNDAISRYRKPSPLARFMFPRTRLYLLNKNDTVNPFCKQYNFSKQELLQQNEVQIKEQRLRVFQTHSANQIDCVVIKMFKHQSTDDIQFQGYKCCFVTNTRNNLQTVENKIKTCFSRCYILLKSIATTRRIPFNFPSVTK